MSDDDLTVSEVRALLGTTRRDARWHLTDELDILCLFARARFDLRQVETTGHEVVEVTVTCAFGAVDFLVPDGTMVVLNGTSFLASANSDVAATGSSSLPRIEITASTVLGRVKVVSPSRDPKANTDDVEVIAESGTAPAAAEPVPETKPAPAQPTPRPVPAASPMPVPKPPPNKYAVSAETGEDEDSAATASTAAPIVPQPPPNKYAVPTPETAAAAPVVPQPPPNKYAVPAEGADADEGGAAA